MAAIPFYVIIGDGQLNGSSGAGLAPQPGFTGTFWTNFRNKPLLMQTVPTSGSAYAPWWDGTAGTQIATTGATNTTVTVTGNPWTTNSELGKYVTVDGGTGAPSGGVAQRRRITGNTSNQLTVSTAWTTNPTASAIHVNDGAWVTYDHIRGADNPLKVNTGYEGDNWYGNQQGGFGFTTSLMQLLKGYHPSGFKVLKLASLGATDDWASGGANQTAFAAELAEAVAAMAPDTPDYRGVIYWNATDISEENLNYVANATSFCSAVRTLMGDTGAEVPIWVVNNASRFLEQSAVTTIGSLTDIPFAQILRQANVALRATITNFHLLDMEGAGFSADSAATYATEDTDPQNYGTEDHIVLGEKAYNAIVRYYADTPTTANGSLPIVVMLGDSQGTGQMLPQYAILGGQESMLGPSGTVREVEWIWNDVEQAWEPYDITANPNTLGAPSSLFYGPEAAMLTVLRERFPDGVALFKMAQGGASLTTEGVTAGALNTFDPAAGTLWDEMGVAWTAAKLSMLRDMGLVPDVVGAVYLLGDNDSFTTAASTAYAAKLATFNQQVRDRFTTRSTGSDFAIVSHKIVQHVDDGGPSTHGASEAREAIRAAQTSRAAADSRFALTSDADLDLLRADGIHYSGRAQDTLGIRLGELLVTMIDSAGSASSSGTSGGGTDSLTDGATTDTVVEGAGSDFAPTDDPVDIDLVVETGSGVTDADSYQTLAEADARSLARGNPTEWSTATDGQRNNWLRQAAAAGIDIIFGPRWSGYRRTDTQSLDWPRIGASDSRTGRYVTETTIPTSVKWAQFEFALSLALGVDPLRNLNPADPAERTAWASSTTDKLPGGLEESRTYDRGSPIYAVLARMEAFAAPFLMSDDQVGVA